MVDLDAIYRRTTNKTPVPVASNPFFDALNAVGQAGASAVGTVAKGVGNLASAAGEYGSFLDPIANAGRISKTFTGNEGVFSGYRSPLEMAGKTIQGGTNALGNAAEAGSVALSGGRQNTSAQWTGGALGNLANIVGGAALGGAGSNALLAKLGAGRGVIVAGQAVPKAAKYAPFVAESLGSTAAIEGAMTGKAAGPVELGTGLVIDLSTAGIGKLLQRGAKEGLSRVPQFTPTKKAALGQEGLQRAGELMFENIDNIPVTTSRETIGAALTPLKKKTFTIVEQNIDDAVKAGAGGATIDDLMEGVKKAVISEKGAARAGLSLDEVPKAVKQIDKMADFYKGLYGDGLLDLKQIQQLKTNLRYKSSLGADALMTAKNQFKEGTRANAQKFLEKEVGKALGQPAEKALKSANYDYNVLKTLISTLKKKAPYSGYLTDVVSGAAGAAGALARLDIGEAVKSAATAVGLKRLATSAAPKVVFAKAVKEGSKKQVNKFLSALAKGLLSQGG